MSTCAQCGHQNVSDATFCANRECGVVLRWDRPPDEPDRVAHAGTGLFVPVSPGEEEQKPTSTRYRVTARISAERLEAGPGAEVPCTITVINRGTVVDQFTAQVLGPAGHWSTCEPASVNLLPDQRGEVTVRFAPPRAPRPHSGPVPFRVRVTSATDASVEAVVEGVVVVAPFHDLTGELTPPTAESRRSAVVELLLTNHGNTPAPLAFATADPENWLDLVVDPPTLRLDPGESHTAAVRVRARRWLWTDPSRRYPYVVTVVNQTGQPDQALELHGALRQLRLLPAIKPLLAALAALVVALVGLVFLVDRFSGDDAEVPELIGRTTDAAQALLEDRGLRVGNTGEEVDPDQEPGTVIAQDPAPGTVLDPGATVDLVIAVGEQTVGAPNVVGQSVDDARAILEEAGLTMGVQVERELAEVPDQVPEGTVVDQDPQAGTAVAQGSAVDLAIAVPVGEDAQDPVPPPPPPRDLPDLAIELVQCQLVPGGTPDGDDALNFLLRVPNNGRAPVDRLVPISIESNIGVSGGSNVGVTSGDSVVVPFAPLQASDYGQEGSAFRLTLDPDNEIEELDEANNSITVRVSLPPSQPSEVIDPLRCGE